MLQTACVIWHLCLFKQMDSDDLKILGEFSKTGKIYVSVVLGTTNIICYVSRIVYYFYEIKI